MTTTISSITESVPEMPIGPGRLAQSLGLTGRLPPLKLLIKPLAQANSSFAPALSQAKQLGQSGLVIDQFLTYRFSSSILIPVDTFSFNFVAPDGPPLNEMIQSGDVAVLTGNDIPISTGIVDETIVEHEGEYGEKCTVAGRDLLGQWEDQDAVGYDSKIIYLQNTDIKTAVSVLLDNTRITADKVEIRGVPGLIKQLLATEPGESKVAALQRFLEGVNCVFWMTGDGRLIIGKPDMSQDARGTLRCSKEKRDSNVLAISVRRCATNVVNAMVPVWVGQDSVVAQSKKSVQVILNDHEDARRLYKLGTRLPKTVVVNVPNAETAQNAVSVNTLTAVNFQAELDGKPATAKNLLEAYARREIARQNTFILQVQVVVPGHYNERAEPYVPDTVYHIEYDRGDIDDDMYLYGVEYDLSLEGGQRTNLYFCPLGSIVADNRAPGP